VLTDPAEKNRCWDKRDAAFQRVSDFYETGPPLFARYMRFSETVPQVSLWSLGRRRRSVLPREVCAVSRNRPFAAGDVLISIAPRDEFKRKSAISCARPAASLWPSR
jgi:hypothetical protein